jgi:hypothetical protein
MKRSTPHSDRESTVVRVVVAVLAIIAVAGQALIYFGGDGQASLNIGMPIVVVASVLAGVVNGFAEQPLDGIGESASVRRPAHRPRWSDLLTFTVVQVVVGELLGLAALLAGTWPSGLAVAAPLLYGGLFAFVAALTGVLVTDLVIWPIAKLVLVGERMSRGRPVNQRLVAVCLAILSVVGFAIFLSLATHVPIAGFTPRGRGIVMIAQLFVDYSGGATNQLQAWIARALFLALAASVVWAVRARKLPAR